MSVFRGIDVTFGGLTSFTISASSNSDVIDLHALKYFDIDSLGMWERWGTYSGTGTVTFKVQHSPNNSDWYDLGTTGAPISASSSSEYVAPLPSSKVTPERYVRVVATVAGGTPSLASVQISLRAQILKNERRI